MRYSPRIGVTLLLRWQQLLTIETDVKQAVRVLEERIARRQSAQAALKKWKRELPTKVTTVHVVGYDRSPFHLGGEKIARIAFCMHKYDVYAR